VAASICMAMCRTKVLTIGSSTLMNGWFAITYRGVMTALNIPGNQPRKRSSLLNERGRTRRYTRAGERAGFEMANHLRPPGDLGRYGCRIFPRCHSNPTRSTRVPILFLRGRIRRRAR
jgi:hypothetical protein